MQSMWNLFEILNQGSDWAKCFYYLPQELTCESQVKDFQDFINQMRQAGRPVLLVCNGRGGHSSIAAEFVKALQSSPVPVYTVVTETAYSAAVTVFAAGSYRIMHGKAQLATHAPRSTVGGFAYNREVLEITGKLLNRNFVQDFDQKVSKNRRLLESLTRQRLPDAIFQEDFTFLTPEQAKALGFCDEISRTPILSF